MSNTSEEDIKIIDKVKTRNPSRWHAEIAMDVEEAKSKKTERKLKCQK